MMIDYHNHTKLCKPAEGEVYQYIEKAIELGISEIAFTDHIPLPNSFDIAHRMHQNEMNVYLELINKARQTYSEIKILFGIEVDYYEGFENYIDKFLMGYDFDMAIMSVHFVKGWPAGNWVFNYDFPDKSLAEIYKEYLYAVIKGIETGLFDVVGHIDLVKKPGLSLIDLAPDIVQDVLVKIKKAKMVLEINTSGYRRKVAEPYPGLDWIDSISKMKIPICTGSDSHSPSQVGLGFDEIYNFIYNKGIKDIAYFDKRKISFKPLAKLIEIY